MFRYAVFLFVAALLWLPLGPAEAQVAAPAIDVASKRGGQPVFSDLDLARGFRALAFGSDLRVGDQGVRIRRFDRPAKLFLAQRGSVDRIVAYREILEEFARLIPGIAISFVEHDHEADVTIFLVDEKQLRTSLATTLGRPLARAFYKKIDPQCVTRVQSDNAGIIRRVHSFIIVDQGNQIFRNCAIHETMHVFGLTHHADWIPWTALNQKRTVNAISEYDRLLLTLLYDEAIRPGMSTAQVQRVLPALARKVMAKRVD